MIVATVITCPQRWASYQKLRANYERLGFSVPLRTFQTREELGRPRLNASLNARAALAYALRHLPDRSDSWLLFLEDDVRLRPDLPGLLPRLIHLGIKESVDCWHLCNRRTAFDQTFSVEGIMVNRLIKPFWGSQALLIPRRHILPMLQNHWTQLPDEEIFAALPQEKPRIFQVIQPILVEHTGTVSTFGAVNPVTLEINEVNHANPSNTNPAQRQYIDNCLP